MSVITRYGDRVRVQLKDFGDSLTDQSSKKSSDINQIMKQYAKTGMLPQYSKKQPVYFDETLIPDAITSFNVVNRARELFYELPSSVRKLCDNDPSKMESVLSDPTNQDFLVKHGVLLKRETSPSATSNSSQHSDIVKELVEKTE